MDYGYRRAGYSAYLRLIILPCGDFPAMRQLPIPFRTAPGDLDEKDPQGRCIAFGNAATVFSKFVDAFRYSMQIFFERVIF